MEFHTFQDTYSFTKKLHPKCVDVEKFYQEMIDRSTGKDLFACDLMSELEWHRANRPYYKVWPCMMDVLRKFDIDKIPIRSFFGMADPTIVILFPKGNEIASCMSAIVSSQFDVSGSGICLIHFCGQMIQSETVIPALGAEHLTFSSNLYGNVSTVDVPYGQVATKLPEGCDVTSYRYIQRICLSVLLMERTPEIFEPDIISNDLTRYAVADEKRKEELEQRSFRRRGQRGYHIGKHMELIPHFRRPHPAVFWTGAGRKTARVVMRSGCLVKRQLLTKSPTGYMGPAEIKEGF